MRYLPLVARQFVERRIGRQRELLHEVVPSATIIHMLVNPNNAGAVQDIPEVALAARGIGLRLQVIPAGTEADIDAAFVKLVSEKAQALLVMADGFFTLQRKQIAALQRVTRCRRFIRGANMSWTAVSLAMAASGRPIDSQGCEDQRVTGPAAHQVRAGRQS